MPGSFSKSYARFPHPGGHGFPIPVGDPGPGPPTAGPLVSPGPGDAPPRSLDEARGTNLCRLGDFCLLLCFVLRCPCNWLPNPARIIFIADDAQSSGLCPGPCSAPQPGAPRPCQGGAALPGGGSFQNCCAAGKNPNE